jgi:phosphatidylglycerophosphatase A
MTTESNQAKPRLAFAIATSLGLGYLPKAPGTWGSLAGILIYAGVAFVSPLHATLNAVVGTVLLVIAGVWSAHLVARYSGRKDPQFVVIDEVSGQHLTYVLSMAALNWQYLLAGFILFRVFDIWKPFPARQAETLHGGLGIMADDWIAGAYAALVLGLARRLGL